MGIFRAFPTSGAGGGPRCWEDRFEEQLIRCNGALRGFPELDLAAGMDPQPGWLRDGIFRRFSGQPAGKFKNSQAAGRCRTRSGRQRRCRDSEARQTTKSGRVSLRRAIWCVGLTPGQHDFGIVVPSLW